MCITQVIHTCIIHTAHIGSYTSYISADHHTYIQIIHTDHTYRSYIQIIHTDHAYRSYIQIIHTDHTYKLCASHRSHIHAQYIDAYIRIIQIIHTCRLYIQIIHTCVESACMCTYMQIIQSMPLNRCIHTNHNRSYIRVSKVYVCVHAFRSHSSCRAHDI
jgi:hypothetical protein